MKLLAILAMVLAGVVCLSAQVPIINGVVSIDFNNFLGQGFSPTPTAGQLDSDDWEVTGLSDGNLVFGEIKTSGDFARGTSQGGITTGGIYAFEVSTGDYTLGVQPGTSDFTPGEFILRLINNTGSTINQINLQYDLYVMNDQPRSNYFNSLYSTDDATYTPLTELNYTSPAAADPSPIWQKITRMATITGLNISDGAYFYIKWESDDVGGSGSRDEFALDNILLSPGDTPLPVSLLSFTARSGPDGILLKWETASEMENAGF
ncbi:MAG: hypothetical protein Kow0037_31160 [Calditrichia bacterium]